MLSAECVIALLRDPAGAADRFARVRTQKLRRRSLLLKPKRQACGGKVSNFERGAKTENKFIAAKQ